MSKKNDITAWSVEEFIDCLRQVGEVAYHDKHPFHILMNDGKLIKSNYRDGLQTDSIIKLVFQ